MVTRNDVARVAGVSPAVVSYVLNDGPRPVAAATRQRVVAAIEALGYRRDGLARALKRGRSDTLGLVIPDITNPFFAELAQASEATARARGHALLVGSAGESDDSIRDYMQQLAERRVDGLLVVSTLRRAILDPIIALEIPVVGLDRPLDEVPISTVRIDNEAGAREATVHLQGHGSTEVCLLNGPSDTGVARAREKGWRSVMPTGARSVVGDYTAPGGESAMAELLDDGPVGAVLVASDVQAIGALRELSRRGLRCPEDVALISIDGTRAGAYAAVPLTSVVQPVELMARVAVGLVLHPFDGPRQMVLPHRLQIRRSCGCAE
ncbi:LacI family DNA-binding transcriptional regulator [Pseudactinotalea sp.]|uniref:LacI family DNA-binding transcriptional regulator n=1 Tax=Pseudactinotalea sp. TaxID=1926260 RepID=UPI003B3B9274